MKKLLRVLSAALLGLALTQPVLAYQNAIQVPTASPLSGLTAIGDINSANLNFITLNSGASAPTTTSLGGSGTPLSSLAGVVWHDTTTNTIKVRNQADTAWVTLLYLDETNGYGGAVAPVLSSSGAQTVGGSNHPGMFVATGAATYTLAHTTTLWNGFAFAVSAQGGAVTVAINGSDAINGGASGTGATIPQGYIGVFKTDGAGNWFLGFEQNGPSGVTAGTYTKPIVTVDAMGHVTSVSSDSTLASLVTTDQSLSGGANLTIFGIGTPTNSSSTTLDCGKNYGQTLTNNVAGFTLVAPSNDGMCVILVTNGASAGTITFSGFTVGSSTGDALDTTSGHKFMVSILRIGGTATYMIKALQ